MQTTVTEKVNNNQVLERYPNIVAHLVCESLGYFTPRAAANALTAHISGEPFACEWYIHMASTVGLFK